MALQLSDIVIDCRDAARAISFWSQALGVPVQGPEDGVWWLEPGGGTPNLLFIEVPEAKTVKNRVHLDLRPDDQSAEVDRLVSLGARPVDIGQGDATWAVLADPEGNEFCVLRPRS